MIRHWGERKNHVYQTIQISLIHPHRHKGEVLHIGIHQEIIRRHLLRDTSCFVEMICMILYAYPEDVCPDLLLWDKEVILSVVSVSCSPQLLASAAGHCGFRFGWMVTLPSGDILVWSTWKNPAILFCLLENHQLRGKCISHEVPFFSIFLLPDQTTLFECSLHQKILCSLKIVQTRSEISAIVPL